MSLSTLVFFADVAQRQTRYACNPWFIQAEPEPPGRLPPAPGSHIRRAVLSPGYTFVSSGEDMLSPVDTGSRTSPFCLTAA